MIKIERVLLAQRTTDNKFLRLHEDVHTTNFDYVDEPELAKRIYPYKEEHFAKPEEAPYYFENSWRARELWLKDCVMVAYEITTEIVAKKI